ncbi:MAG: hypothetical protein RMJ57_01890 [Bacteroidia bacterium]|nr:hypothetical protein [Bacteroidia bacterium]
MRGSKYQLIEQKQFKRPIPNLEKRVGRVPDASMQYYSYIIADPSGRRISLEGYFRPRGSSTYEDFSFLSWEDVAMYIT